MHAERKSPEFPFRGIFLVLDIGEMEAVKQVRGLFLDELPLLFPILEEAIDHLDVALGLVLVAYLRLVLGKVVVPDIGRLDRSAHDLDFFLRTC